jgi:hypothetical protein
MRRGTKTVGDHGRDGRRITAHAPSLVPRKYPAAAFEFELEPKPTLYEFHKSQ